jgi:hypothetical protein
MADSISNCRSGRPSEPQRSSRRREDQKGDLESPTKTSSLIETRWAVWPAREICPSKVSDPGEEYPAVEARYPVTFQPASAVLQGTTMHRKMWAIYLCRIDDRASWESRFPIEAHICCIPSFQRRYDGCIIRGLLEAVGGWMWRYLHPVNLSSPLSFRTVEPVSKCRHADDYTICPPD